MAVTDSYRIVPSTGTNPSFPAFAQIVGKWLEKHGAANTVFKGKSCFDSKFEVTFLEDSIYGKLPFSFFEDSFKPVKSWLPSLKPYSTTQVQDRSLNIQFNNYPFHDNEQDTIEKLMNSGCEHLATSPFFFTLELDSDSFSTRLLSALVEHLVNDHGYIAFKDVYSISWVRV